MKAMKLIKKKKKNSPQKPVTLRRAPRRHQRRLRLT